MEYQQLGKSGLSLSRLSFGSWVTFANQLQYDTAKKCMIYAYDQGVNFFDNAEIYANGESEILMGKILTSLNWSRSSFCVSSKVFWGGNHPTQQGLSKKHIHDACHAALKRLNVDYLDLYFCHRPDPNTPIEETVLAMNDLIIQGKILYWGTSEWEANQLHLAYDIANKLGVRGPTMEQPEYNLFTRQKVEKDYNSLFKQYGLGTTIWSPLCSGWLTGKYQDGIPENSRFNLSEYDWLKKRYHSDIGQTRLKKVKQLQNIANELGISLTNMAIAWCLKNSNVSTVILGASNLSQLKENLSSISIMDKLDATIITKIESI